MTIKRIVHCDNPDCPHEGLKKMSDWVRTALPDSATGFMVSDLDFVLWNVRSKRVMLLEVKTRNGSIKRWQRDMWNNLHHWIKKGICGGWEYLGFHLLRFSGNDFSKPVYFDNEIKTEEQIKQILSLGDNND